MRMRQTLLGKRDRLVEKSGVNRLPQARSR
jgi:hypothetical protein